MARLLPILFAALLASCTTGGVLGDDDDVVVPDDDDSTASDDDDVGCAEGFHDDGQGLGVCVPEGACADQYGIPDGAEDCVPIGDFCPEETCRLLVGWDGQCLYEMSDDLTSCDGTSADPCITEFACQAGACEPQPRQCSAVRPVVLVHGINGSSANFDVMAGRLLAAGWPEGFIYRFDAADPQWGCNVDNAVAIAALVDQAMAETCEPRIDLVAHSMGTLSSRYFVKNLGGTELVNSYATLGGMHHGVLSACFAPDFLGVCVWQEICEWGDFVTQLNAPPATPGDLSWVSIYGTADTTIANDSSYLDGAENIVMDGVDHVGLLEDEATWEELRQVLARPCW